MTRHVEKPHLPADGTNFFGHPLRTRSRHKLGDINDGYVIRHGLFLSRFHPFCVGCFNAINVPAWFMRKTGNTVARCSSQCTKDVHPLRPRTANAGAVRRKPRNAYFAGLPRPCSAQAPPSYFHNPGYNMVAKRDVWQADSPPQLPRPDFIPAPANFPLVK